MTQTSNQQKAWSILTKEEQVALNLGLGYNKSSWKVGEIMGKSHYKYLEIYSRAKFFFKLFTEYFNSFHELVYSKSVANWEFVEYINLVIEKRYSIKAAVLKIDSPTYYRLQNRNISIIENMEALQKSKHIHDQKLLHIIKDFDRWNNFRILPLVIQEPSAFKRRNKHRARRLIKSIINIDSLMFDYICDIYAVNRNFPIKDSYYIPLMQNGDPRNNKIIRVRKSSIEKMTKTVLLAFTDLKDAQTFIALLITYWDKKTKHCKDGQIFWPLFREVLDKSVNYNNLQNIIYSRKHIVIPTNKPGLEY